MPTDDELYAFLDGAVEQDAAESFAGAVVKVYKVFASVMTEETAEVMAREYWNFLLDNAQAVLDLDAQEAPEESEASDDVEFRG